MELHLTDSKVVFPLLGREAVRLPCRTCLQVSPVPEKGRGGRVETIGPTMT